MQQQTTDDPPQTIARLPTLLDTPIATAAQYQQTFHSVAEVANTLLFLFILS